MATANCSQNGTQLRMSDTIKCRHELKQSQSMSKLHLDRSDGVALSLLGGSAP